MWCQSRYPQWYSEIAMAYKLPVLASNMNGIGLLTFKDATMKEAFRATMKRIIESDVEITSCCEVRVQLGIS